MVDCGGGGANLVLCAPDKGAVEFVEAMHERARPADRHGICKLSKERAGERKVEIQVAADSKVSLAGLAGKDIVVFDDMVRTGSTIVKACQALREGHPRRVLLLRQPLLLERGGAREHGRAGDRRDPDPQHPAHAS